MKDYHIYVHGQGSGGGKSPTSPQYRPSENKTTVDTSEKREYKQQKNSYTGVISAGKVIATASKINSYVGELTENYVTARRNAVGLSIAGLVAASFVNPVLGLQAAAMYFGDKAISYGIKVHKENLSADFLRQLSGGTVRMGR